MTRSLNLPAPLIPISVTVFLFTSLSLLIYHVPISKHNFLDLAFTIDLLMIVPAVYFLLIRKTKIPNITIVPILFIGVIIGSLLLPQSSQSYLNVFKTWGIPIIELSIFFFVLLRLRRLILAFRSEPKEFDFYTKLTNSSLKVFPPTVAKLFTLEFSVIYYAFFNWHKPKLNSNQYTYHKDSGGLAVLGVVFFLLIAETFVFHVLLQQWSMTAAWILTGISIYTGLQLLGFIKSLSRRPIEIGEHQLILRYGIMSETLIKYTDIEKVETSSLEPANNEGVQKLSLLGDLESHNLIIYLKGSNVIQRLYGMKKKYRILLLHIDNQKQFTESLKQRL